MNADRGAAKSLGRAAVAAAALVEICLALAPSHAVAERTPARYIPILERAPFGPPPPKGPTPEELEQQRQQAAQAAQDEPYVIPPGLDKIKITLLSRFHGVPAVGFADGTDNSSYYLTEGQAFNGITCQKIDFEAGTVLLARNGFDAELPLWINPATTNRGDVTTFGQPGGRAVDLSTIKQKTDWEEEREKSEARKKLDEVRERRRKEREEIEERRRKEHEEFAALTPEQRRRRMHDINLDIIMNDKGPPLPIPLDDEDIRQLRDAGFEVPDQADEPGEDRPRPTGRRRRVRAGGREAEPNE